MTDTHTSPVTAVLQSVYDALTQAQDCIRDETPEDITHEEAREDTINKVRDAMRAVETLLGAPAQETLQPAIWICFADNGNIRAFTRDHNRKELFRLEGLHMQPFYESQAKATEGKAGMAGGVEAPVRRSTAGTGLRVGEASADLPATSEIMDVTAGETAPFTPALPSTPSAPADQGAPEQPTEAMLNAARDWSIAKYGIGIGNDAAIGCWQAMLGAAFTSTELCPQCHRAKCGCTFTATERDTRPDWEQDKAETSRMMPRRTSTDGGEVPICSLCSGTGKVFHEAPPRKNTPWSKCHCGGSTPSSSDRTGK